MSNNAGSTNQVRYSLWCCPVRCGWVFRCQAKIHRSSVRMEITAGEPRTSAQQRTPKDPRARAVSLAFSLSLSFMPIRRGHAPPFAHKISTPKQPTAIVAFEKVVRDPL